VRNYKNLIGSANKIHKKLKKKNQNHTSNGTSLTGKRNTSPWRNKILNFIMKTQKFKSVRMLRNN